MPDRLISSLTRLQIDIPSVQPLDLSLKTLEEKIIQEFKTQTSIEQICQKSESSIYQIYKTIKKNPIPIKIAGRYTPNIKRRIQEASRLHFSTKEITEIFHLKKSEAFYLSNLDKKKLKKDLSPFVKFVSPKSLNHLVFYKVTTYTSTIHNHLRKV